MAYVKKYLCDKDFDDLTYLEVLDRVANTMQEINEKAMDGDKVSVLEHCMYKLIPSFTTLCGVDLAEVEPEQPPEPEPIQEEPEQLPDNFIKDDNGWGLCPVCRKKMVKLTNTTRLVDFPAYCKACRSEYLISWWNVEDKEIEYKRYVNDKQYIDRRNIRSEGMKGTGVQGFMRTRTSATERVAMSL